jgi:uncharacterized glyoxalase superfamily protein PhnB
MPEPQSKPIARLKKISPQFVVPDVVTAAEYYRDVFGFTIRGYWQNPPVFAIVARDDVEIQLGKADARESPAPNTMRRKGGLDVYIWVSDVDTRYAELRDRGAKIVEPPELRIYKCYEMVVEDKFGYRLVFSIDVSGQTS